MFTKGYRNVALHSLSQAWEVTKYQRSEGWGEGWDALETPSFFAHPASPQWGEGHLRDFAVALAGITPLQSQSCSLYYNLLFRSFYHDVLKTRDYMIQRGRWLILVVVLFLAACSTSSPPLGPVNVSITPGQATLAPGETREFTAIVSGTPDTDVTWSATGGEITGTGNTVTYTAPAEEGSYTLTATSQADPGKQATATVTVSSTPVEEITVAIDPTSVTLAPGATRSFSATITGTDNTAVTWNATGGSIEGSGNTVTYTAPDTEGTFTVTATS